MQKQMEMRKTVSMRLHDQKVSEGRAALLADPF